MKVKNKKSTPKLKNYQKRFNKTHKIGLKIKMLLKAISMRSILLKNKKTNNVMLSFVMKKEN